MRAITICEPYATLISRGLKRVENRTWPAPNAAIWQPIAIHAGKSKAWLSGDNYGVPVAEMQFGKIIATARLADCISLTAADLHPLDYERRLNSFGWNLKGFLEHQHTEGPFCWVLDKVQLLSQPIPYAGAQGLWNLPDHVLELARPHSIHCSAYNGVGVPFDDERCDCGETSIAGRTVTE